MRGANAFDVCGDFFVRNRIGVPEGLIFQLGFILPHAQPLGKGGKDVQGFLGNRSPFVIMLRLVKAAHLVQTNGDLHQKGAHVGDDGH